VATRGSRISLEAAAAAAGAGGDGALGDAGALGLHQRRTQLPQQGAGAPPRRQGARQHPYAVQKREGLITIREEKICMENALHLYAGL